MAGQAVNQSFAFIAGCLAMGLLFTMSMRSFVAHGPLVGRDVFNPIMLRLDLSLDRWIETENRLVVTQNSIAQLANQVSTFSRILANIERETFESVRRWHA